jgi:acetyl esterase/lipase
VSGTPGAAPDLPLDKIGERAMQPRKSSNRKIHSGHALASALAVACLAAASVAAAQQPNAAPKVVVDPDGTVHMPAQIVPVSSYLSTEGKAYLAEHLIQVQRPEMLVQESGVPPLLAGYLARQRELFAVDKDDAKVGGVHAFVYTPKSGVAESNRNRVLIDLHGGGFRECWPGCAELESMPIASLGRIKVVSVDYRQGPKYHHPAASEDVAAVYRELLKTYRPENVGIYGCSAGGMLTGMSVAWFQRHEMPRPGAIGILCAGAAGGVGAAFGGDANFTTMPLGEGRVAPDASSSQAPMGYFAGTDPNDPLVAPASSPEVLAKFPPTLIVTATRGFELSNAVYTHTQLVKQGVDADLHVWEGMFHGFFYNPEVPESRDCYDVIIRFFASRLGKR